ncbi:MAG TPA: TatD family hydrolase [Candidatus Dormibacteraeota bacterium]|nr:TatD family hydrolase [Candidatus Dormibacteraeota bacterium]
MLIDTHAHVHGSEYDADRAEVLRRALAGGVEAVIAVGTSVAESEAALALAHQPVGGGPEVYATYGLHPHDAKDAPGDLEARILLAAQDERMVAVGEVGLDYHYDHSPRAAQREVLRRQIRAAVSAGKPLVFHQREAEDDFSAILRQELPAGYPGLVHCFTGDAADARRWTGEFGLLLAVGGAVTFKSADAIREAVRAVGHEHLVFETDAPYMTPAPHRGKRNEPLYVTHVAAFVADLLGVPLDRLAAETTARARAFFRLPAT